MVANSKSWSPSWASTDGSFPSRIASPSASIHSFPPRHHAVESRIRAAPSSLRARPGYGPARASTRPEYTAPSGWNMRARRRSESVPVTGASSHPASAPDLSPTSTLSSSVSGRKGDRFAQQCEGGGEHPLRPHIVAEGARVETVRREELRVPGEGVAAPAVQIDQRQFVPRRRRRDVLVEQLDPALVERPLHHPRHRRRE